MARVSGVPILNFQFESSKVKVTGSKNRREKVRQLCISLYPVNCARRRNRNLRNWNLRPLNRQSYYMDSE